MAIYRQGDVILIQLEQCPADIEPRSAVDPAPKDPRGLVLAEGETSNHYHAIFGAGCKLFRYRGMGGQQLLVTGKTGPELRVVGGGSGGIPRHEPFHVAPGSYVVRTQRAWTSGHLSRLVQD